MIDRPTPDLADLRAHVRRVARAIALNDAELADEIEQETLLIALKGRPANPNAWKAWLGGIASNVARFGRYRIAQGPRFQGALTVEAADTAYASTEVDPASALEAREIEGNVREMMAGLPVEYREVVRLRAFEDLPPRKVAGQLGIPVETVRSRYRRGLEHLRRDAERRFRSNPTVASRPLWSLLFAWLPKLRRNRFLLSAAAAVVAVGALRFGAEAPFEAAAPATVAVGAAPAAMVTPTLRLGRKSAGLAAAPTLASLDFQMLGALDAASRGVTVNLRGPDRRFIALELDVSGAATVDALEPGRWTAHRAGRWLGSLALRPGVNRWEVQQAAAHQVHLRVVDESSAPVQGADVFLYSEARDQVRLLGRSGDAGQLRAEVPLDATWIAARHTSGRTSWAVCVDQPAVVGQDGPTDLVLENVATREFALAFGPADDPAGFAIRGSGAWHTGNLSVVDDRGLVRRAHWLPAWDLGEGRYAVTRFKDGICEVHDGERMVWCGSLDSTDGSLDAALAVRPYGAIAGQLVDERGDPQVGIEVTLSAGWLGRRVLRTCPTDANGYFAFDACPAETYRLWSGGVVLTRGTAPNAGGRVDLEPCTLKRVQSRVDSRFDESATVVHTVTRKRKREARRDQLLERLLLPDKAPRTMRFDAGPFDLGALTRGDEVAFLVEQFGEQREDHRIVLVPIGELRGDTTLDLRDAHPATATATIRVDRLPARAIWVDRLGRFGRRASVDQETGQIESGPLAAGEWWLWVLDAHGRESRSAAWTLEAGHCTSIGAIAAARGPIQLSLETEQGTPLDRLQIRDIDGSLVRTVAADEAAPGTVVARIELPEGNFIAQTVGRDVRAFAEFSVRQNAIESVVLSEERVIIQCIRTLPRAPGTVEVRILDADEQAVLSLDLLAADESPNRLVLSVAEANDVARVVLLRDGVEAASRTLSPGPLQLVLLEVDRMIAEHASSE